MVGQPVLGAEFLRGGARPARIEIRSERDVTAGAEPDAVRVPGSTVDAQRRPSAQTRRTVTPILRPQRRWGSRKHD